MRVMYSFLLTVYTLLNVFSMWTICCHRYHVWTLKSIKSSTFILTLSKMSYITVQNVWQPWLRSQFYICTVKDVSYNLYRIVLLGLNPALNILEKWIVQDVRRRWRWSSVGVGADWGGDRPGGQAHSQRAQHHDQTGRAGQHIPPKNLKIT